MNTEEICTAVLADLKILVLEPKSHDTFKIIALPIWLFQFFPNAKTGDEITLGDKFPVLKNFLINAESFSPENKHETMKSGIWTETVSGNKIHLEASLVFTQKKIVVIQAGFERLERAVQIDIKNCLITKEKTTEIRLNLMQLLNSINSFVGIISNLLCRLDGIEPKLQQQYNNLGQDLSRCIVNYKNVYSQTFPQQKESSDNILEILDSFAEFKLLERFNIDSQEAPNVLSCVEEVVESQKLPRGITVKWQPSKDIDWAGNWKVAGETSDLLRVIQYIFSKVVSPLPANQTVTYRVEEKGNFIITTIENKDFQRDNPDKSDDRTRLDDYCTTIEYWGGRIVRSYYNNLARRGVKFELWLRKVD